jgi:hypothetical protein
VLESILYNKYIAKKGGSPMEWLQKMNAAVNYIEEHIPFECQEFVLELDQCLTEKGSKRTIKTAKSGFVTSYSSPKSGKALLNYVFRKNGVKMRIYAAGIGEHSEILSDFPENMKKDIMKAGDCKKLSGLNCSPACAG